MAGETPAYKILDNLWFYATIVLEWRKLRLISGKSRLMLVRTTKPTHLTFLLLFAVTIAHAANDESNQEKEKPLRLVPLVTSTPLAGTGVGAAASYLYKADVNSPTSQLQVGGQYSDTDSITTFIRNNAFLKADTIISNSWILWSDINSEFDGEDGRRVEYKIESITLGQKLLFQVKDNVYLGGQTVYKNIEYSPNNEAGADFLFNNGIVDEESVGVGIASSYDTRENKYYPSDAYWVDVDLESFPNDFGADNTYYKATINARYYKAGFAPGDVWANQLFGQYASQETPDSALPTLSGKSLLRGFPAGQFKARSLTGMQTEYRYQIVDTPFRLVAFGGVAELDGGSFGQGDRERDDDGMYWAAGVGGRYAIQSRTGVDLRLDLVTTNENEQSVYLALNQAF
jgi:hypothetical protein